MLVQACMAVELWKEGVSHKVFATLNTGGADVEKNDRCKNKKKFTICH